MAHRVNIGMSAFAPLLAAKRTWSVYEYAARSHQAL